MPMIAGAMIYKLKPYVRSEVALAALVIASIPMADGIANAGAAWPVIAALNTNVGYAGTWIASFITLGLALTIVWIVGLLVASPAEAAAPSVVARTETPIAPIPVGA
jgi:hypothetical protein